MSIATNPIVLSMIILLVSGSPTSPAKPDWSAFINGFIETYFAHHPDAAVNAGRHEFDGKLPDWSREGITKEITWLHSIKDSASSIDPSALPDDQRFERDYLLAVLDRDLFWLEDAQSPFKNPSFYQGSLDPNAYLTREYAPLTDRMKSYIAYAKAVPAAAAQIKDNLSPPFPRTFIDIGITTFGGLASYYKDDVPKIFALVSDWRMQQELRSANQGAIEAMRDLASWLERQKPEATDAFAMGADRFQKMLWATERVDTPLDRLEKIGQEDLDRNLRALREACKKYAPDKTVQECVELIGRKKPDGGPVEGARKQLTKLKQYISEKGLVTIPGTEEARVAESPPYMRWNSAYIDIPGPYEKGLPSIYYIAPPDPSWSKKEQEEYIISEPDLLFTSVHEVWPGHFLQFLHSNRSRSKFGQIFVGYAFAEGWAHYAEEMMWEAGLGNGDPEVHIGELMNALVRNVRFVSAIRLHTNRMTVAESERMFREQAFQDPGNARQQAARGTFDPAYLNYTMGKLMIRKLREEWTSSRGGRAAWLRFHDTFLSFGGPPIPLVHKAMTGTTTLF